MEQSYTAGETAQLYSNFGKQLALSGRSLHTLPNNPEIPFLDVHSKKKKNLSLQRGA